jgi:ABC-2 type transport system permease protein
MSNFVQAIWTEWLKARRSRMLLFTALGFAMFPLGGGFFMVILKDPEFARKAGLLGAKAQLTMGTADWPTYLNFLALGTAIGGIVLFTFIGSWVFGREYSDRTVKDLLALPTSRTSIVLAKYGVIGLWSTILVVMIFPLALSVGALVGLPPVPNQVMVQGGITLAVTAVLTIAVITPIIFFASYGHGYLAPVGVMILAVALAQVMTIIGYGEFFPWAIAGVYAQGGDLGGVSLVIVILTCIAGITGTLLWWEYADQTH